MTYEDINRDKSAQLLEKIDHAMESVRFTGRIEFRDGKWVGIYGGSE